MFAAYVKSQRSWNVTFRVRLEDKETNKIYLDPIIIPARRVVLKDNVRMFLLKQEILGKKLFPLLNHHTRPGVYDLLITADNRIFIITGIDSVDEQRRELKVGIRYPGIDYSLDELNKEYAKLNQQEKRSDLLGIVKAAATAIIVIVLLIAFIVGGRYYIEGKEIEKSRSEAELQLMEGYTKAVEIQEQQTNAMIILVDKLTRATGGNIQGALQEAST